jgi:hypothetical protein
MLSCSRLLANSTIPSCLISWFASVTAYTGWAISSFMVSIRRSASDVRRWRSRSGGFETRL